jgi:hypothetical protein
MSSKEYMYFDTRDNYVPPEQVRKNIKAKLNSLEYKNAVEHIIREMKIEKSNKFKK